MYYRFLQALSHARMSIRGVSRWEQDPRAERTYRVVPKIVYQLVRLRNFTMSPFRMCDIVKLWVWHRDTILRFCQRLCALIWKFSNKSTQPLAKTKTLARAPQGSHVFTWAHIHSSEECHERGCNENAAISRKKSFGEVGHVKATQPAPDRFDRSQNTTNRANLTVSIESVRLNID